ncbi:MAG: beta strand repeat-containing protein, partial [Planctomycetia bacterium]
MDAFTRRVVSGGSRRFCVRLAVAAICLGGLARPACAATYWWNTTTTGLWSNGANWSNAATGGSAGTPPSSSTTADDAVFNQTGLNGNTIVELDAARSIGGITFLNTGSTLLRASASGTQTLTLGSRGITLGATAGPVTIGDATNAIAVTLTTSTFTNDSATPLRFVNAVNPNNTTVTVNGTGGVVFDGGIPGGAFTTKAGSGNLSLNGSNPIGSLTVSAGTLTISGTGFLTGGPHGSTWGPLPMYSNDMTNNGAFVYSSSSSQTMFSIISGTGSFTMAGPSRFYFLRNNTYTGLTTISSGTLHLGNWQNVGTFSGNVVNNGVLIFDANAPGGSESVAFRRVMSGTGRVVLSGGGYGSTTLTLSGSTEFGGRFAVRSGNLTLNFGGTSATGGTTLTDIVAPTARVFLGQGTANGWTAGALPAFTNTLTVTGSANVANSQSLAGVTIDDGLARVTVTSPAGGSTTLSMGELGRSAGSRGIVNVTGTAAGTVSILTTTTNANGIIGPWATVTAAGGAIHWATSAAAGGTAGALTAYSAYTNDSWSAGANTNVTGTGNNTVPANAVTNSLRLGTAVTLTLAGTSTVTSGGVLFAGGNSTITGGALRGSPTDGLQITTNASPTIASPIVDNGGPTPLTFIPLSGALTLSGQSTYTGRTTLMGSVVLASVQTGTSGPLGLGGSIEFPASMDVRTTDGAPRFTYGRLNSHDYSTRFTTAADQVFSGSVPAHQRVTWSGSFGNAGTGGLNVALNGDLTLTGSNAFPNGVNLGAGVQGTLTLGSVDAIGSSGSIFLNSSQSSEAGGPRLRFTAASAGLDLGSRLAHNSLNFWQVDTNGQDVTFRTRMSTGVSTTRFFKQGDGRLTLSGSTNVRGFIVVGGTLARDSGTIAEAWTNSEWLAGMGVVSFLFSGAAAGTRTQTVPSGLYPQAGLLTVAVQSTGTTTMLDISGGITRSTAALDGNGQFTGNLGTVDFRAAGGTFGTTAIVRTTTSQALTNGIIGPWATVAGSDWATHTSGTILPYTAYTDVTSDSIADGATTNARITTTTGTVTLGAGTTTVNTLLQAAPTAATIRLSGSSLLTGGVMAAAGAGRLTIGDAVGSGTLQPATGGGEIVLSNFSSGSMTVNSVIANNSSASRLTISGNGTVVLTASNTLTGVTAVQGGTLRIGGGGTTGSLASSSVYLSAGARLVFDRTDDYGGQAAYMISTMGYAMGSPGGIEVRGGSLTLAGDNRYYGTTLLAGGTVTMAHDNALNQSNTIQIGYRTGPITFTGGVLRYASSGVTMTQDLSGRIVDSTSPIVVDTNGLSGTWGFSVAASNVAGLTKRGGGTLSLTNINAYLGTTTIEGGRLVGAAQSFPGDVVNSGTLTFSTDALNVGGVHAGTISGT